MKDDKSAAVVLLYKVLSLLHKYVAVHIAQYSITIHFHILHIVDCSLLLFVQTYCTVSKH